MYYYYSYTTRHKQTGETHYWDGLFYGNIVTLIKDLKSYNKTDDYNTDYTLIFYKEIKKNEYKKLKDIVG